MPFPTPKKVVKNATIALAMLVPIGIQEVTGECSNIKSETSKQTVSTVTDLVPALGANDIGCSRKSFAIALLWAMVIELGGAVGSLAGLRALALLESAKTTTALAMSSRHSDPREREQ
ncbi:uncharacterized protein PgNI_08832 [Pyricularia grisea]|uniref:Uncharacterized protein n=1 Tax=Pyricularia grisea TaxID=148305 RepID=A0A6P8AVF5_PYRGI|nr:uncharacterized protein PgNI_08832 [Pyricularia grisea]TLD06208.1 hypothetical protein PgNI_08832 [Pyricularia grisea]